SRPTTETNVLASPTGISVITRGTAATGIQTSVGRPIHSPLNPGGVTPTISYATPVTVSVRPTTSVARAKRLIQYASLTTATGVAALRSSCPVSARPIDGVTPTLEK